MVTLPALPALPAARRGNWCRMVAAQFKLPSSTDEFQMSHCIVEQPHCPMFFFSFLVFSLTDSF